jgi:hypothetical protein
MKRLDAITLDFARQVIEEETGSPLDIGRSASAPGSAQGAAAGPGETPTGEAGEARLIARDDKKNPLISTFDWTADAVQRIFRVPAGFMRNKTQERIEELARERRAEAVGEGGPIDVALVEDGIEIGKRMMAEMIATYPSPAASATGASPAATTARHSAPATPTPVQEPAAGGGYLNEVRSVSAAPRQD